MSIEERNQPGAEAPGLEDEKITGAEKTIAPTPTVENGDVEIQTVAEPEKGYYSKLSVWLMVLFSGLAIGSDG